MPNVTGCHVVPLTCPDQDHLQVTNALAKLGHYAVITVGPSFGGALVASAGPGAGVGCNAVSFFVCAALMRGIAAPPPDRAPQRFVTNLAEGWSLVRATPPLISLRAFVIVCVAVGAGVFAATHPALAIPIAVSVGIAGLLIKVIGD